MLPKLLLALLALLPAGAALAHPGAHDHMSWSEMVQHMTEPFHVGPMVLVVLIGWLGWRAGHMVEARLRARTHKSDRKRP